MPDCTPAPMPSPAVPDDAAPRWEDAGILDWVAAGWDAHPVVPPNAEIHPSSEIEPKNRGKVPGVLAEGSGMWFGLNWRRPRADRMRLQQGELWGVSWSEGNGGVRSDDRPAIDIDCLDPAVADELREAALRRCGPAPVRVGQAPKCLLVYAAAPGELAQPTRVFRWRKQGEKPCGIEILAAGRQYVVKGDHPGTMRRYAWNCDPLAVAENGLLTPLTAANLRAFLDDMRAIMERHGWEPDGISASGAGRQAMGLEPPPAKTLRAHDMAVLASAVAAIPNNPDTPREAYISLGYALKAAAGQDREGEGFDLWAAWADRWEPNDPSRANSMETLEKDWERLHPPYFLGADYVYDLAADAGWSRLPVIQAAFRDDPLPHDELSAGAGSSLWLPPQMDLARHRPRRDIVTDLAPEGELAIVAGQGGVGKTALAVTILAHAACGRPFGPFAPAGGKAMKAALISAEEPREVAELLLIAAAERHMLPVDMIRDNVRVIADVPCALARVTREHGVVATDLLRDLERAIEADGVRLAIADPAVHLFDLPSENDNAAVGAALGLLRGVARRTGCAIVLLHHTPKVSREVAAKNRTEATMIRGGSAWVGAARLAATLTASTAHAGPDAPPLVFRIVKRNDRPAGPGCAVRIVGVPLLAGGEPTEVRTAVVLADQDADGPFSQEAIARFLAAVEAGIAGPPRRSFVFNQERSARCVIRLAKSFVSDFAAGRPADHARRLVDRLLADGRLAQRPERDPVSNKTVVSAAVCRPGAKVASDDLGWADEGEAA